MRVALCADFATLLCVTLPAILGCNCLDCRLGDRDVRWNRAHPNHPPNPPAHLRGGLHLLDRVTVQCQLKGSIMQDIENRSIAALKRLTDYVSSGASLDEVLDFVYEEFQPLLPYQRIGFAEIDVDRGRVTARWARSDRELVLKSGFSAPLAGSSLELLLTSQRPRVLNDLVQYLARHPQSLSTQHIVEEGFRSSFTCPLLVEAKPVGFLFFTSDSPNAYSYMHTSLFQQIAGQLALQILLTREQERSRKMLSATVALLMSVLEMVAPVACGQATRVRRVVQSVASALQMKKTWELELAALLCRLSYLTVPNELAERQLKCGDITSAERALLDSRAEVASELLFNIPSFQGVAEIVRRQCDTFEPSVEGNAPIRFAASVLRAAVAFDGYRIQGMTPYGALAEIRREGSSYAPGILVALESVILASEEQLVRRNVRLRDLAVGMRLEQHVVTAAGKRLISAGHVVTDAFLRRLRTCGQTDAIQEPIAVAIPHSNARFPARGEDYVDRGNTLDLVT